MKWEYLVEWLPLDGGDGERELRERLAKLGGEGWELATVTPMGSGTRQAIFKRPIPGPPLGAAR